MPAIAGAVGAGRRRAADGAPALAGDPRNAQLHFQAQLLEAVEQAIIATDLRGNITYWSRQAERLYGWTADQAIGRNLLDAAPPAVSREQGASIVARLRAGNIWSGHMPARHRDGSVFLSRITAAPLRD